LNIDGAYSNGVIGGSEGEWLRGFSKLIGTGDVYTAEIWSLYEGLKLARSLNVLKVEVRIDSIEVVWDINHKRSSTIRGKPLVDRICRTLEEDWEVPEWLLITLAGKHYVFECWSRMLFFWGPPK
jgi:hypothetical protein